MLALQQSLLADGPPGADASFRALTRRSLGAGAWVEHQAAWLSGSDRLFAELGERLAWQQPEMAMYQRMVRQPRLTAGLAVDALPPALEGLRRVLADRYGPLDGVWCNLYRDGHDSVAWHGDRVGRGTDEATVVVVSVGARRPFLLRPAAGGTSIRFELGRGDLLVMGGTCQRTWHHCVPKVAAAHPRISVTFRRATD